MDVQNIGDILHVIILTLILVWLFYHQWLFTKMWEMMRQMMERMPANKKNDTKDADRNNNRQDSDFQMKR